MAVYSNSKSSSSSTTTGTRTSPTWDQLSTEGKIAVIVTAIVLLAAFAAVIRCCQRRRTARKQVVFTEIQVPPYPAPSNNNLQYNNAMPAYPSAPYPQYQQNPYPNYPAYPQQPQQQLGSRVTSNSQLAGTPLPTYSQQPYPQQQQQQPNYDAVQMRQPANNTPQYPIIAWNSKN